MNSVLNSLVRGPIFSSDSVSDSIFDSPTVGLRWSDLCFGGPTYCSIRFSVVWSDFYGFFVGLIWFLKVDGVYCFSFFFQLVGWCGSGFGFVFWWLGAAVVGSDDSGSCHCCNCGSGWVDFAASGLWWVLADEIFYFFFFGGDWQWLELKWIDFFQLIN